MQCSGAVSLVISGNSIFISRNVQHLPGLCQDIVLSGPKAKLEIYINGKLCLRKLIFALLQDGK